MIEILFTFDTIEEAKSFLNKIGERKQKKENDGRGKGTRNFHIKAKLYQSEHPNKTYRECLQELKQTNKNTLELE
jgi:hypothetical protein